MKDYVSREALIALARPGTFTTSCDGAVRQDDAVPVRVIQGVPAANVVEVRHGRWEHNDDGYGCEDLWWCSACKEKFVLIEGTPRDNGYYYCPHCGAKMDGGVNDARKNHAK